MVKPVRARLPFSESIIKTVRFQTPVFKKYGKHCARNHGSVSKARYKLCAQDFFVKKHEKNCARNLALTSAALTLFSTILQSEPLMLKHVWGTTRNAETYQSWDVHIV